MGRPKPASARRASGRYRHRRGSADPHRHQGDTPAPAQPVHIAASSFYRCAFIAAMQQENGFGWRMQGAEQTTNSINSRFVPVLFFFYIVLSLNLPYAAILASR